MSKTLYESGSTEQAGNKAIGHYAEALRLEPRLATPEFNAHAIDNELLLAALLQAHSANSAAKLVPRIYKDPERVRVTLLPQEPRTSGPAESRESTSRRAGGIRSSGGSLGAQAGEMDEPVSETREPERADLETESAVPSGAAAQAGAQRRERPRRQIIRQPVTPAPPATPAGPAGAAAAREVVPPRPAPRPSVLPSPAPAAPEFEPIFSSTGRLDLRLVPNPQDRLASLADAPR